MLLMELCLLKTEIDAFGSCTAPSLVSASSWYVVHCKTGREKSTSAMLQVNLGLIVYVPEKRIWRKGHSRFIPLFPGYFFIQVDLQQTPLSQINTSQGVLRLLGYEGAAQAVPSHLVEALRGEIARLNEYYATLNHGFRPGDTLYVREGPLSGLESVFVGPATPGKRVQVLLHFLGGLTRTEIEASALEKRVANVRPERVRYTRGKGKRIRQRDATSRFDVAVSTSLL